MCRMNNEGENQLGKQKCTLWIRDNFARFACADT